MPPPPKLAGSFHDVSCKGPDVCHCAEVIPVVARCDGTRHHFNGKTTGCYRTGDAWSGDQWLCDECLTLASFTVLA